jgi:hypothetical protein
VSRNAGASSTAAGSRMSASMYDTLPSAVPATIPSDSASTSGSLSTYTTRAPGAAACAISWMFGEVGMPVPMSRNCRIPAS